MYDTSFDSTTIRERDVRKDPIIAIGTKCPVTSRQVKAPKPLNSTPEWEWKTFPSPRTTGMIEGTAPTSSDAQSDIDFRYQMKSRFIKQFRYVELTKEAQLMVRQYSETGDPWQNNINYWNIQLHRDVEATSLADTESVPPSVGTVASTTRGIARWLSNASSRFTDTATTPVATVRTPTTSIQANTASDSSDFTEAQLRRILQSVASSRQEDSTTFLGVCAPSMRTQFTTFSMTDKSGSTSSNFPLRRWNMTERQITASVTKYNSDFGPIDLMTSFLLDSTTLMLLLDMGMVEIGYAQDVQYQELFTDGVKRRGLLDVIFVEQVVNPQACGIVTTRNTA